MKKNQMLALGLSAVLALSLAACGGNRAADADDTDKEKPTVTATTENSAQTSSDAEGTANDSEGENGVQIAAPFFEYDTLEELIEAAGFDISLPDTAEEYDQRTYQWYPDGGMMEITLDNGSDTLSVRKASGDTDISGDYNTYAQEKTVDGVTIKGDGDGFVLAVWTENGYTYSASVTQALPQDELLALAAAVS